MSRSYLFNIRLMFCKLLLCMSRSHLLINGIYYNCFKRAEEGAVVHLSERGIIEKASQKKVAGNALELDHQIG